MNEPTLYLLGAPRLERGGEPIGMDTRKATALLAYLALESKQHARDSLAALLWPEYGQSSARAALRRTLSVLKEALGENILEISREAIGIRSGAPLWFDVAEFRCLVRDRTSHGHPPEVVCPHCLAPLGQAAALHQDHFMAGFTLRDSPAFDDWQFFQTETLRRELNHVLELLIQGHSMQKAYETAIGFARRLLASDALHEPAHRQLMELYALAGQRSAAMRQYHECVRILNEELGVEPLEETVRLYEEIKAQRLPTGVSASASTQAPGAAAGQKPRPAGGMPLVGREREWPGLLTSYENAQSGGYFLVLEGEAGIGKTRLAEEFLQFVRPSGAVTLTGRCYPEESSLALAPFLEIVRSGLENSATENWHQLIPDQWLAEAARLLPSLGRLRTGLTAAPDPESPGAQLRFFEGLSQVIFALAAGAAPGVLFLDDLQWADETSLDLLTYLVRRLRGHPLLILVAWRSEDLPGTHRLRRLQAETQRSGYGGTLVLERLSGGSVAELVRAAFGNTALPPAFYERVHRETEGLPFFLNEYLAILAQASPEQLQKEWNIPQGVRDLISARLAQAGETGRQLLQAAAVIGRSFDFDILHEASGRSEEETITTLEALVTRGLIRETQSGGAADSLMRVEYDFFHEKIRSLIYAETSLARRRLLHQRVAELMAGRARGQEGDRLLAGQLAYHYRQAGRAAEAANYYRAAAEMDRKVYANAEALAHLQAALALGHPDTAGLDEAIGDLHTRRGDYPQALASYQAALACIPAGGLDLARLERKLGNIFHRLGEWQKAYGHFESARAALRLSGDAGEYARLLADWSRSAHRQGDAGLALEMASQALHFAEAANDGRALAQAHNSLGILARSRGELPGAIEHLERSLEIAGQIGDMDARAAALNNLSLVCANAGELERALAYTHTALDLCLLVGDRHREAALHNNLADLYHAAGQEEQAMLHLKQAVTIFSEIGASGDDQPHPEIWKLTEW